MCTFSHHSHAGESPKKINIAYYPSIITIILRGSQWRQRRRKSIIEIRPLILKAIIRRWEAGVRFFHFIHSAAHRVGCKIFAMQPRCVSMQFRMCNGRRRENSRGCIGSNAACDFQGTRDAVLWLSHHRRRRAPSTEHTHLCFPSCAMWRSAHKPLRAKRVHRIGCFARECVQQTVPSANCCESCAAQGAQAPKIIHWNSESAQVFCALNLRNVLVALSWLENTQSVKLLLYYLAFLCAVDTATSYFRCVCSFF